MEEKIETRARDGKSETDRQVAVTPGKRKSSGERKTEMENQYLSQGEIISDRHV